MTRVLVTGASGFVGSAMMAALSRASISARAAYRTPPAAPQPWESVLVGPLSARTDWSAALAGVSAVVHCAGPAHARFSEAAFNEQIARASAALATQAEAAGVRRFIYLSSIKAMCAHTSSPITEDASPQPEGGYGRAKLAAEGAVLAHAAINPVALRAPLVIAPNAKANFRRLMQLAASGLPLPFAGISNQRSLISLESLIAAVSTILARPDGPSGVFHLGDQPALSTPAIVDALCKGLGRRATLFRAPTAVLPAVLTASLVVEDRRFRTVYGEAWSRDVSAALAICGAAYWARNR